MDSFDIGTGDDDVPLISEATTDNRKKMTVRLLSGAIAIVFVVIVVSVGVSIEPTGYDCYEKNINYPGKDINNGGETKASSTLECQKLCQSTDGCILFSWVSLDVPDGPLVGREGECWLKHTRENKGTQKYVISGPRQCDEVIFISGGVTTETSSELVDVAPSGAGCARVTGQLPDKRFDHSMDLLNGELVICGGASSSSTSCIAASSPSGPWSAHSTTTGSRWGHGSSTVGGAVHLIGGQDSASMERWEGAKWITKANPPVNFGWGTCATNVGDNTIVVIGGDGSNNKVARYRVEEDEWEELGEVPVGRGRYGHGCVSLGDGQVLVGGGYDIDEDYDYYLRSCGIYHIEEGRWEDVGDMNSARFAVRFVAVNVDGRRRFYALGGYDGSSLNSIEEFDRKTKTWGVSPVCMAEGRDLFDAVVLKKTNVC